MLQPTSATVQLGQPCNVVVQVGTAGEPDPETGTVTFTPSTTVPTVSVNSPASGVSYTASAGQVVMTGVPDVIPNTTWHWLDSAYKKLSGSVAPTPGSYSKITAVDSPPTVPANTSYTYTIAGEPFTLIVSMPSYNPVSAKLKTLLASVTK